jgi:hypothetical protein
LGRITDIRKDDKLMEHTVIKKGTRRLDATPTWEGLVRPLIALVHEGETYESRQMAKGELRRMARLADCWVEYRKEQLKAEEAEREAAAAAAASEEGAEQ